jgi:hypothetical protein
LNGEIHVHNDATANVSKRYEDGDAGVSGHKVRRRRKPPREVQEPVEPLWEASELFPVALTLDVPISLRGLGLGVKTYADKVIVTSFRALEGLGSQEYPAQAAGVRIGDQIVLADGLLVDGLPRLLEVLKGRGACGKILHLTVLRW